MSARVLLVDRVPHPFFNGVTRYMRELARQAEGFAAQGIDLRVLYWGLALDPALWLRLGRPRPRVTGRLTHFNRDRLFDRGVRGSGAALLHLPAHDVAPHWLETGIPTLLSVHGAAAQVAPQWNADSARSDRLRETLAAAQRNNASFVTYSRFARDEIVAHYGLDPERVSVIAHGVDHDRFHVLPAEETARIRAGRGLDAPYVLYLGPCAPRKNVERMVEGFARAAATRSLPHRFVIAGRDHPGRAKVAALAERLGIRDRVVFLGSVRDDEIAGLYAGADAFAFVSRYEGFGMPVIEAMACGTPVITSALSATGELAGDAAVKVADPEDADEIAAGMGAILTSPDLALSLRERGILRSKQFGWQESVLAHGRLYDRIIRGAASDRDGLR